MNRRQHCILPILMISGTKFVVDVHKCQISCVSQMSTCFLHCDSSLGYRQIKFGRKSCSHIMLASTTHYLMAWDLLSCSGMKIKIYIFQFHFLTGLFELTIFPMCCSHFFRCHFIEFYFSFVEYKS